MRRAERVRLFLDLLELGLKDGRTPEQSIQQAAACRDRLFSNRFHRLAAWLSCGEPLSAALKRVPSLLPAQVVGMLAAGERLGSLQKVIPACRKLVGDSLSQSRAGLNYIIILTTLATPVTLVIPAILSVKVLPAYRSVFEGMFEGSMLPAFTRLVLDHSYLGMVATGVVLLLVWGCSLAYVGGPRLHAWLKGIAPGPVDGLLARVPWRRARLQRDFSSMLAVLLDAQVPEPEAVTLAAQATANGCLVARANRVVALLRDGVKLSEAIRQVDSAQELQWRLGNALQRGSGFTRALAGWHERLDARAFQLEQTAAHLTTTSLVLFNGVIIGAFMIAIFLALIALIYHASLW